MSNVLIQCGDHLENQLRILPLAKWLKSQGYNPVVMLYRKFNGTCFLKNGIDVISLDIKTRSKSVKSYSSRRVDSDLVVNDISFKQVMQAEFNKQPYLTLPKYKVKNEKKFTDNALAISDVIARVKPSFIFVWNGYTGIVANFLRIYCAQNKVPCSYLERGFKKGSLYVDPQGVNGFGSLSDKGLYPNSDTFKVDLEKVKTVLVPLQVQTDTNIIYNSDIKTMREFVFYVREQFDEDVILYVKTHPEEVDKNLNLPLLKNVVYLDQCDLNHYIKTVDLVVTINSTVGMTAIFEGTPTVALGKAIFSGKKLAISKSQFESKGSVFELSYPDMFMDDLEQYFTFSDDEPSKLIEEYFEGIPIPEDRGIFNDFDVIPSDYLIRSKELKDRLHSIGENGVRLDVYLGVSDGLDLTYRNTNTEVTIDWIKKCFSFFNVDMNQFTIVLGNGGRSSKLRIAMLHTKKMSPKFLKSVRDYDYVVNEYFDLIESKILNNTSNSIIMGMIGDKLRW